MSLRQVVTPPTLDPYPHSSTPPTRVIMTGNGFFMATSKKPVPAPEPPLRPARFRDAFVSSMQMQTQNTNTNTNAQNNNLNTLPHQAEPKDSPKKGWSFGGLFKRKSTNSNTKASSNLNANASPSPSPARKLKGGGGVSSSESDDEPSQSQAQPQSNFQKNFLVRRLSRRKDKKSPKKEPPIHTDYLRVPNPQGPGPAFSPQSWEVTKRAGNAGNGRQPNHSSSGSLSVPSQEGSGSTRGSRKEAVKARAVARRESFLGSSSSDEEEAVSIRSRNSLQGSALSLGARRIQRLDYSGRASASPKLDRRNNNNSSSPAFPRKTPVNMNVNASKAPGSPRWEARVVYTQENHEDEPQFIVKLPTKRAENSGLARLRSSESPFHDQVITAGLRVPLQPRGQGYEIREEVTYANLQNGQNANNLMSNGYHQTPSPPPPPPRRDFSKQFLNRPVSCSYPYLDPQGQSQGQEVRRSGQDQGHLQGYYPYPGNVRQSYMEHSNRIPPAWQHHPQQRYLSPNPSNSNYYPGKNPLQRSPSEPPENRVEAQVHFPPRNAATPTPMPSHAHPQTVAVSKLGYPVRRLTTPEQGHQQLPLAQSPIHMRASEFWRKKEAEVTGQPYQGNPNHRRYMNMIRSADSSPLPQPRRRVTPSPLLNPNSTDSLTENPQNHNHNPPGNPKSFPPGFGINLNLPNGKTPGKNLEDALNELEDMYKSLRLSDEDLLDRAERRDLPTPHQELRSMTMKPFGSIESLTPSTATGSSNSQSGSSASTNLSSHLFSSTNSTPSFLPRRAPPLRRSSRPDKVEDDMARRLSTRTPDKGPMDPRILAAKAGSYMVLSPAFSPPVSPCPPALDPVTVTLNLTSEHPDPDLTLDDVSFRQYQKANSIRIIDPQPPFGIPLGPITAAPGTDYLHSKKSDRIRPLFNSTKRPDLVNDDIAFRNLRKDLNPDSNLSKDWTPRLFSPNRNEQQFSYDPKKLRAIRSLSANVSNFAPFPGDDLSSSRWGSHSDLAGVQSVQRGPFRRPESSDIFGKKPLPQELEEELQFDRKYPSKKVQLTPDLYDPSRSRRPWTDLILSSFEKEEEERLEREREMEKAEAEAENEHQSDIDDEVFLDARDKSKSTSPEKVTEEKEKGPKPTLTSTSSEKHEKSAQEVLAASQFLGLSATLGISALDLNRRGSWVESRSGPSLHPSVDPRRRSWSDYNYDPQCQQGKLALQLERKRAMKLDQFPTPVRQASSLTSVPSRMTSDPHPDLDLPPSVISVERKTRGEAETPRENDPSSIDALIDSINLALPELEAVGSASASCSSGKSRSSLSTSGSSPSVPGSPTLTRVVTFDQQDNHNRANNNPEPEPETSSADFTNANANLNLNLLPQPQQKDASPPNSNSNQKPFTAKEESWPKPRELSPAFRTAKSRSQSHIAGNKIWESEKLEKSEGKKNCSKPIYKIPPIPSIFTHSSVSPTFSNNSITFPVKPDSPSHAGGVSFIKKLLRKEKEDQEKETFTAKPTNSNFSLQKSPSLPAKEPLQKFQTDQAKEEREQVPRCSSVAQKANFFMKLEHAQRFSKWRKEEESREMEDDQEQEKVKEKSKPPIKAAEDEQEENYCVEESKEKADVPEVISNSSTSEEPSALSLKDRVHLFDKITSKSPPPPRPFPLTTSVSTILPPRKPFSSSNPLRSSNFGSGRRGSASDIDPLKASSSQPPTTFTIQIPTFSTNKEKISKNRNQLNVSNDELSEDAEFSSGGQEVADIISKSYENSPISKKKNFPQKLQKQLSKEIWRRKEALLPEKGDPYPHPLPVPLPETYQVTTNVKHTIISTIPIEISESKSTSPPDTSNLLQFLSVSSFNANGKAGESPEPEPDNSLDIDIDSVKRESQLLVMRKNVTSTPLRRNSSGSGKNPLKVLKERMDLQGQDQDISNWDDQKE